MELWSLPGHRSWPQGRALSELCKVHLTLLPVLPVTKHRGVSQPSPPCLPFSIYLGGRIFQIYYILKYEKDTLSFVAKSNQLAGLTIGLYQWIWPVLWSFDKSPTLAHNPWILYLSQGHLWGSFKQTRKQANKPWTPILESFYFFKFGWKCFLNAHKTIVISLHFHFPKEAFIRGKWWGSSWSISL